MNENQDLRIANLLNADAPVARDPLFRVRVLESREHQRFQRRLYTMLAGTLIVIFVSIFAIRIEAGALESMGAVAVVATLASGYLAFRRSLPQILRRFTI